ncbi:unnamed protein product [Caenorhabditis brenneri]
MIDCAHFRERKKRNLLPLFRVHCVPSQPVRTFFLPYVVTTSMRKSKFIQRILDWCNKFKLDLLKKIEPPVLQALPTNTTPPKRKFPIFRLPFLARRNVLLRLELDDLIPLSLLSKRCKLMIKQALPPKIAQYDCTVWPNEVSSIKINSRFGSYIGFEPDMEHIIELLSYPPIRVPINSKNAVFRAANWVKRHQNCVTRVSFPTSFKDHETNSEFVIELNSRTEDCTEKVSFSTLLRYREMIVEFVNSLLELNLRIDLGGNMVVTCSPEEVRIENLNILPINFVWSLNCQKLRIVGNVSPIVMAHRLIFSWASSDISASSTIKQLIFELRESEEIKEWILEDRWKKSGEELQYPIYGKINEYYKMYHESKKVILFETHHDGKKLLVVDLEQYGLDI